MNYNQKIFAHGAIIGIKEFCKIINYNFNGGKEEKFEKILQVLKKIKVQIDKEVQEAIAISSDEEDELANEAYRNETETEIDELESTDSNDGGNDINDAREGNSARRESNKIVLVSRPESSPAVKTSGSRNDKGSIACSHAGNGRGETSIKRTPLQSIDLNGVNNLISDSCKGSGASRRVAGTSNVSNGKEKGNYSSKAGNSRSKRIRDLLSESDADDEAEVDTRKGASKAVMKVSETGKSNSGKNCQDDVGSMKESVEHKGKSKRANDVANDDEKDSTSDVSDLDSIEGRNKDDDVEKGKKALLTANTAKHTSNNDDDITSRGKGNNTNTMKPQNGDDIDGEKSVKRIVLVNGKKRVNPDSADLDENNQTKKPREDLTDTQEQGEVGSGDTSDKSSETCPQQESSFTLHKNKGVGHLDLSKATDECVKWASNTLKNLAAISPQDPVAFSREILRGLQISLEKKSENDSKKSDNDEILALQEAGKAWDESHRKRQRGIKTESFLLAANLSMHYRRAHCKSAKKAREINDLVEAKKWKSAITAGGKVSTVASFMTTLSSIGYLLVPHLGLTLAQLETLSEGKFVALLALLSYDYWPEGWLKIDQDTRSVAAYISHFLIPVFSCIFHTNLSGGKGMNILKTYVRLNEQNGKDNIPQFNLTLYDGTEILDTGGVDIDTRNGHRNMEDYTNGKAMTIRCANGKIQFWTKRMLHLHNHMMSPPKLIDFLIKYKSIWKPILLPPCSWDLTGLNLLRMKDVSEANWQKLNVQEKFWLKLLKFTEDDHNHAWIAKAKDIYGRVLSDKNLKDTMEQDRRVRGSLNESVILTSNSGSEALQKDAIIGIEVETVVEPNEEKMENIHDFPPM